MKRHTKPSKLEGLWVKVKKQKFLLAITVPFILYIFLFNYLPLAGWIWSLFDYRPGKGLSLDVFVGLENFAELFSDSTFWLALRNTLVLSLLHIVFGTLFAITFAVLLNEIVPNLFKKMTQTVSYLPHFVSWVVVAGIFINLLRLNGGINNLLMKFNIIEEPFDFLLEGKYYWTIITSIGIWKETGWAAIIYLAAMTSINTELYEAAYIDGAGRWKRIWHITLPEIRSTIIVLLIMNIGWVLTIGFEQTMLFGNAANFRYSEVLSTYIYRYGLKSREYSFGMAASVFQSATSFLLLVVANGLFKRFNGESVF